MTEKEGGNMLTRFNPKRKEQVNLLKTTQYLTEK